jgi:hypothetical protein
MRTRATNQSAAAVGVVTGLAMFFVGPMIDVPGPASSVWLLATVAGLGFPWIVYVLGVPVDERHGLWVLKPVLLKRVGSCLLAAGATMAVASVCTSVAHFVQVDHCLDSGGRWNHDEHKCDRRSS